MPELAKPVVGKVEMQKWALGVLMDQRETQNRPGQRTVLVFTETASGVSMDVQIESPGGDGPSYAEMALAIAVVAVTKKKEAVRA